MSSPASCASIAMRASFATSERAMKMRYCETAEPSSEPVRLDFSIFTPVTCRTALASPSASSARSGRWDLISSAMRPTACFVLTPSPSGSNVWANSSRIACFHAWLDTRERR